MAQTSFGWKGTVSEVQWAQLGSVMGQGPCVLKVGDARVTQVAGTRAVTVAAGSVFGDGVLTTLSSAEQVALPAPTNGQWFLLVLNRVWSTKATILMLRNGPTTATATSGLVPSNYPASTATSPGGSSDVPVAWLWGNSTGTAVTIVPLLRAPVTVQPRSGPPADRDALHGAPTALAAQVALQGQRWFNTATGRTEHYYGAYDQTSNPQGSQLAAGWYPTEGRLPYARYWKTGSFNWLATPQTILWDLLKSGLLDGLESNGGVFTIRQSGRWRISGSVGMAISATGQWANVYLLIDGNAVETAGYSQVNNVPVSAEFDFELPLLAGQTVAVRIKASQQFGGTPTIDGGQATKMALEYIGPA